MRQKKKLKPITTPLAALLLLLVITVTPTRSQVNQLTGMATQQVPLAPGVTLQYTSDIDNTVKTRNELSTGGWCGLGWKLGFPSIFVDHCNTVDIRDDRWFFDDGYGNYMEVVRINRINFPGEFHFKNSPQKKITVSTDNTTGTGALRIYGWTVTELDGSKMIFGYNPANPTDEIPCLPCWNNTIGKGMGTYTAAPEKFYYRWPLRQIVQPDGQTTQIDYTFISGQTTTGYSYTKELYPLRITRPDLSRVELTLGTKNKDANEGYCRP
jgi:hypothetical protein